MRRCLIILALLLAGCGPDVAAPPALSVLDLSPCPGWQGARPETEGELARAAAAEQAGRLCANAKLQAVADLTAASPQ